MSIPTIDEIRSCHAGYIGYVTNQQPSDEQRELLRRYPLLDLLTAALTHIDHLQAERQMLARGGTIKGEAGMVGERPSVEPFTVTAEPVKQGAHNVTITVKVNPEWQSEMTNATRLAERLGESMKRLGL